MEKIELYEDFRGEIYTEKVLLMKRISLTMTSRIQCSSSRNESMTVLILLKLKRIGQRQLLVKFNRRHRDPLL